MPALLTLKGISKKYGRRQVLHDLSFEVQKGEVYGLLGPNGSGKSTTLGIVLGVIQQQSGQFEWFGGQFPQHVALQKIGALIEKPNFYPYLSAYDNLRIACLIKNTPTSAIHPALELVGLADRSRDAFKTFSLGMKQRLAIASAMLNQPELLILDEPTNGLDPEGIRQIRDLIVRIAAQGTTILLASHLLDEVEKTCNKVIIIKQGRLLYDGPVGGLTSGGSYYKIQLEQSLEHGATQLQQLLQCQVEAAGPWYHVFTDRSGGELNRVLMQQGLVISALVHHKTSLEDQFIHLTQQ